MLLDKKKPRVRDTGDALGAALTIWGYREVHPLREGSGEHFVL
jgi:hypothetical protein